MEALYREMIALETPEAKLYKAMDKLEAIVQHNESDDCDVGAARVSAQHDVCGRRSRVVAGLARAA